MTANKLPVIRGILVEEEIQFTLFELSRVCRTDITTLQALVEEGVLTPINDDPQCWQFAGTTLQRARTALRLTHDLELSTAGTAIVLNLLDEIAVLKSELRRLGYH